MKNNTKSSITLPQEELKLVEELQKRIGAKSKVEVIRRGLKQLKESTDRNFLRNAYKEAANTTRASTIKELEDLDHLSTEGTDEW